MLHIIILGSRVNHDHPLVISNAVNNQVINNAAFFLEHQPITAGFDRHILQGLGDNFVQTAAF